MRNISSDTTPEHTRLFLPPLALAGCLRGIVLRDTTTTVLDAAQRENYFPAMPLMTLAFWFEGEGDWLATPGFLPPQAGYSFRPLMLHGPFTRPTHTRNGGPASALFLLFLPDAFSALTGIDPGALVNTVVDARAVLPADWVQWAASLAALPDNTARVAAVEAFLQPRWESKQAHLPLGRRFAHWADALAVRAATSGVGRSVRQAERRVKAWVGLPMREIRAVSRAEQALFKAAATLQINPEADGLKWADLAAESAYADQSHFCRETRRITGFSPEQLMRRVVNDEAFWCYRIWR